MLSHRIVSRKTGEVFDFRAYEGSRIFVNSGDFNPYKGNAVYVKKGKNFIFYIAEKDIFVQQCRRWYKNEMARRRRIEKRGN